MATSCTVIQSFSDTHRDGLLRSAWPFANGSALIPLLQVASTMISKIPQLKNRTNMIFIHPYLADPAASALDDDNELRAEVGVNGTVFTAKASGAG